MGGEAEENGSIETNREVSFKSGWAKVSNPADEAEMKPPDSVFDDLVRSRTGVGSTGRLQITMG